MPNWCFNILTLRHPDPAMLEKAVAGFKAGAFFATLHPEPARMPATPPADASATESPPESPDALRWHWRLENWGTTMEVGADGGNSCDDPGDGYLSFWFETAWSPPVAFYRELVRQGFMVEAFYHENGMRFCGAFNNAAGDTAFDLPDTADLCRELIPEAIRDAFDLPGDWYEDDEADEACPVEEPA